MTAILPAPKIVESYRAELSQGVHKAFVTELAKAVERVERHLTTCADDREKRECVIEDCLEIDDVNPLENGKFGFIGEVMHDFRTKLTLRPDWMDYSECSHSTYSYFGLSGVNCDDLLSRVTSNVLAREQIGWKKTAEDLANKIVADPSLDASSALKKAKSLTISPQFSVDDAASVIFGRFPVDRRTEDKVALTSFPFLAVVLSKKGFTVEICYVLKKHRYQDQSERWTDSFTESGYLRIRW